MEVLSHLKFIKVKKMKIGKIGNKNDIDVATDVAQVEHSKNKCYALVFGYIYRFNLKG